MATTPRSDDPNVAQRTSPTLRERNRARTRQSILDACVVLELAEGGALRPELFTYARIAELAGVSERTVYRMFPTKRDLDRAYVEERPLLAGVEGDGTVEARGRVLRDAMRVWSRRIGRVPRDTIAEDAFADFPDSIAARDERDNVMLDGFRAVVGADVDDAQLRALVAAVHSTISVATVVASATRWQITLEDAADAHAWAYETLVDALQRKDLPRWERDTT